MIPRPEHSEWTWLDRIEALVPGDPCEFLLGGKDWQPGTVVVNGSSLFWAVKDATGKIFNGIYHAYPVRPQCRTPLTQSLETSRLATCSRPSAMMGISST